MNRKRIFRAMAAMVVVMLAVNVMCSKANAQVGCITDIKVAGQKGTPFTKHNPPFSGYEGVVNYSITKTRGGVTIVTGELLDCNKNSGKDVDYVSIFYKSESVARTALAGKAISDIVVIEGEKTPVPPGYTKVDFDLNKGCGSGSKYLYLAFKRTTANDTHFITDIRGYSFEKESSTVTPKPGSGEELVKKYGTSTVADLAEKCKHGTDYIRLMVTKAKIK